MWGHAPGYPGARRAACASCRCAPRACRARPVVQHVRTREALGSWSPPVSGGGGGGAPWMRDAARPLSAPSPLMPRGRGPLSLAGPQIRLGPLFLAVSAARPRPPYPCAGIGRCAGTGSAGRRSASGPRQLPRRAHPHRLAEHGLLVRAPPAPSESAAPVSADAAGPRCGTAAPRMLTPGAVQVVAALLAAGADPNLGAARPLRAQTRRRLTVAALMVAAQPAERGGVAGLSRGLRAGGGETG